MREVLKRGRIKLMFNFVRQHKTISMIVGLDVIAIVVVTAIFVIQGLRTCTIDINVAPSDAIVTLNGATHGNLELVKLFPGNYHVEISREGMQTKTLDISLSSGDYYRLREYLLDDDSSMDYYYNHSDEVINLENISDDPQVTKFVTNYNQAISIMDLLPYTYDAYSDNYTNYTWYEIDEDPRSDCPKVLCLKIIDKTGGNEQNAIKRILELGYNPDDYELTYELQSSGSAKAGDE